MHCGSASTSAKGSGEGISLPLQNKTGRRLESPSSGEAGTEKPQEARLQSSIASDGVLRTKTELGVSVMQKIGNLRLIVTWRLVPRRRQLA